MIVFRYILVLILIVPASTLLAQSKQQRIQDNWHQWRGPHNTGVSTTAAPPLRWSETENIQWKSPIEGNGTSTPIIWGNRVFLLTAINTGIVDPSLPKPEDQPMRAFGIKHPNTQYKWVVICLNRETGKELWRRTAAQKVPHEGHHSDNNYASASPVVAGGQIYCWFGSAGLYVYKLDGTPVWSRDLGKVYMGAALGEGCSPVVHGNRGIIVRDQQRQSSIEVLDTSNGKTVWRSDREEGNAWATPAIAQYNDSVQVITCASNYVRSYNLEDGDLIWQCSGLTGNATPCPIVEGDRVLVMTGYKGHSAMSLPITETGDISDSDKIHWTHDRGTPYVPSPVLLNGTLFFNQSNTGIWTSLESRSGKIVLERTRLPGIAKIYASPIAAGGHLYVTGIDGLTLVLRPDTSLQVVASNKLNDTVISSASFAGKQLFLRGDKYLYCISETP
ncbi:MAG: PQQ-binding-like beta-propeller repeat protein [Planctomycetota bacterium]|nr:PQQ-binding-like beta-propeller repeat protein [Planctomycetota bacterium]